MTFPSLPLFVLISFFFLAADLSSAKEKTHWFKGNTHTHSLWSDGNDFPEMIAKFYKDNSYHFLVLSDHNVLSRGEK
ncbi:MAG TPA: histidinol-phosphatase, partial [Verrucomicrobia bacterium]|nr:histidinol-phosphatase [Verrucomicrobiota bacterium]